MVSYELLVRPPRSWVSHFARSFGSLKFAGSHPRPLLHLVLIKMFHVLFRIHGSPRSVAGKLPSVRFRWRYWADRYFWWGLALFPREGSFSWAHCAQWRKKVESTWEDSTRKSRYRRFQIFSSIVFLFLVLRHEQARAQPATELKGVLPSCWGKESATLGLLKVKESYLGYFLFLRPCTIFLSKKKQITNCLYLV